MARIGPVILETAGDAFTQGTRINAIVWEGSTASGDQVILKHRTGNEVLWRARTDQTQTYVGLNAGGSGIHAPNGFYVDTLSNGVVMVYLREE